MKSRASGRAAFVPALVGVKWESPRAGFCIFKASKCSYISQPQEACGRQQQEASQPNKPGQAVLSFFPLCIAEVLSIPVLKLEKKRGGVHRGSWASLGGSYNIVGLGHWGLGWDCWKRGVWVLLAACVLKGSEVIKQIKQVALKKVPELHIISFGK